MDKRPSRNVLVIAIVSIVAVLAVAVIVLSNRPAAGIESGQTIPPDLPRGITEAGHPYLGDQNAPVTLRIYEDLGCPNCRNFWREVEPEILENYVIPGQVRFEIYTLAFVNPQSLPGAEGVYCAQDQRMFWEFREVLFSNQGVQAFDRRNMTDWAEALGLDRSAFGSCFDLGVHQRRVVDQSQEAFEVGINATPTIEVNGVRHVGVVPFEADDSGGPGMRQILEEALAQSGQ